LVFMPKYRRAVINERVLAVLKAAWQQVCTDFEYELREVGWEADHVHFLVAYPPKVALPEARQLTQGRQRQTPARCQLSRGPEQAMGRTHLVAQLLRGVLRRSPARDRQTLHPSTARKGFLPDSKDGVSASEAR